MGTIECLESDNASIIASILEAKKKEKKDKKGKRKAKELSDITPDDPMDDGVGGVVEQEDRCHCTNKGPTFLARRCAGNSYTSSCKENWDPCSFLNPCAIAKPSSC